MTSTVEMLTLGQVRARRARALSSVTCDEATLRARGALYFLDARELAVLNDLDALDFLLAED